MIRRRTFRRPFRRTFRRRFKPFAHRVRPKYDRITLFNTLAGDESQGRIIDAGGSQILPCGPIQLVNCSEGNDPPGCQPCPNPPCPDTQVCCGTTGTIRLIDNSVLESFFQDRVTLVSIQGDVWIRDLLTLGVDTALCGTDAGMPSLTEYYSRYAQQVSLALRKFKVTQQPSETASPLFDFASPIYLYDWTEAQWLWQRHRFWAPRPTREEEWLVQGSRQGCCPDVHGGATNVVPPIASGSQPTYDINTNVSTDCNPCIATSEGCPSLIRHFSIPEPPWQHFRIGIRRHITLRADDNLDLQLGLRHPVMYSSNNVTGWGCDRTNFPGEHSNWSIHARIQAIVRLN